VASGEHLVVLDDPDSQTGLPRLLHHDQAGSRSDLRAWLGLQFNTHREKWSMASEKCCSKSARLPATLAASAAGGNCLPVSAIPAEEEQERPAPLPAPLDPLPSGPDAGASAALPALAEAPAAAERTDQRARLSLQGVGGWVGWNRCSSLP
jgi:hypothetical protein